jgi:hypothetical protein
MFLITISACDRGSRNRAPADLVGNLIERSQVESIKELDKNSRFDGSCRKFSIETGRPELRMTEITKSGEMYSILSTIDGIFKTGDHVAIINRDGEVFKTNIISEQDSLQVTIEPIDEFTAVMTSEAYTSFPGELNLEQVILVKISDQDFEELADNLNFYCQ